jgi:spore coat protein U-like protein
MKPHWQIFLLVTTLIAAFHMQPAQADVASCQASSATVAFGSLPSINAAGSKSSGEIRISCTAVTAQSVRVCLNVSSATFVLRNAQGNTIDASIYRDALYTSLWQTQTWIDLGSLALDGKGSSTFAIPIYAMITTPSAAISAGTFTAMPPLLFSYGAGCANGAGQITSLVFQILAMINPTCALTTNDLHFGVISPRPAQPIDLATSLSVTCTNNTTFNITIGRGNGSGVNDPRDRRMQGANGAQLSYGIYTDAARSIPWDFTNGVPGLATGRPQIFNVYGRINPSQSAPAGFYRDTVIVTVLY